MCGSPYRDHLYHSSMVLRAALRLRFFGPDTLTYLSGTSLGRSGRSLNPRDDFQIWAGSRMRPRKTGFQSVSQEGFQKAAGGQLQSAVTFKPEGIFY